MVKQLLSFARSRISTMQEKQPLGSKNQEFSLAEKKSYSQVSYF
jgi:hypothetical protein